MSNKKFHLVAWPYPRPNVYNSVYITDFSALCGALDKEARNLYGYDWLHQRDKYEWCEVCVLMSLTKHEKS